MLVSFGASQLWGRALTEALTYFTGMDVVVLLCAAMLMNSRKEKLRYKLIDEKWAVM